jgi:hypothetical protein
VINIFGVREREREEWAWQYRPVGPASSPATSGNVLTRLRLNDSLLTHINREMERKEKINTKFFGRGNLKETYQS